MGQQQLLLVILVTIIVGIATVVAINVFGSASDNANRDAVRQDMLAAAAQAQGEYAKPSMMGGLGKDFEDLDLRNLGIPSNQPTLDTETSVTNDNGVYTLSGNSGDTFTITGDPSGGSDDIELVVTWNPTNQVWDFVWDGEAVTPEE